MSKISKAHQGLNSQEGIYGGSGGGESKLRLWPVKEMVVVNPKPNIGLTSKLIDSFEKLIIKLMYDPSQPHHYLSGNFAPVPETPLTKDLPVTGYLTV